MRFDGAGSYGAFQIDNYQGHARIHTLGSDKYFQVIGGSIFGDQYRISSSENALYRSNVGKYYQAAGWAMGPYDEYGLILEYGESESGGIFLSGDELVLWSPGDGNLLSLYDEDQLPSGTPRFWIDYAGNVNAVGSKNFAIDHPLDPENKFLFHAALEGPEAGVYYRGEAQLTDGTAVIELPEYFESLTRPEDRTVLLTPIFESDEPISNLAASRIQNGRFTVRAIDSANPDQVFCWEVKAVRADIDPLQVERSKSYLEEEKRIQKMKKGERIEQKTE